MNSKGKCKVGDVVELIHMQDKQSPGKGATGTVVSIDETPYGVQYDVDWINGYKLPVIPGVDKYKVIGSNVNESSKEMFDQIKHIKEFKNFKKYYDIDMAFQYLTEIRLSGIVNMLASGTFLVLGKEGLVNTMSYLDTSGLESRLEDMHYDFDEYVNDLGNMAEDVRNMMIMGGIKKLEEKGEEVSPSSVQRILNRDINTIVSFYTQSNLPVNVDYNKSVLIPEE